MYPIKTPAVVKRMFPHRLWNLSRSEKSVYLTFDDGPTPEITPFVLQELERFQAKGTFFLIGRNVAEHPALLQEIQDRGHRIGNHTYSHLNGWKTDDRTYAKDIDEAQELIPSDLFRPPYGRLRSSQAKALKETHQVVMWDVLSGDFDGRLSPEQCTANVMNNVENGSIVVFHDSRKAAPRLMASLPKVLTGLSERGFRFEGL